MKISSTKQLVRIAPIALAPVILVYVGYWFYLGRDSLAGFTAEDSAFRLVGEALLEEKVGKQTKKVGKQTKFAVGLAGIDGPDMCSFWTFEAVRTNCQGVSLVVRDFKETDREETIAIARHIAEGLARPCQHVHLVAPSEPPRPGFARPPDQAKISADLGCGSRIFSYRVRVQVRASTFIKNFTGGGHYDNRHIYTHSLQGEIT